MKFALRFPGGIYRPLRPRIPHLPASPTAFAAAGCDVTLAAAPSPTLATAGQLHDFFGGTKSERLQVAWLKREVSLGPIKIRSGAHFFRQLDPLIASLKPDGAFTMHVKAADHLGKKHPALPLIFEAHEIFADTYSEGSAEHRLLARDGAPDLCAGPRRGHHLQPSR